jgi:transcriptional accessory protein Tex/SPT6
MGGKIPEAIRRKVLREWLEGLPLRQIARDNRIGRGTVNEIIKAIKKRYREDRIVLRETAVMLRREGSNIDDFAESIRLKRILGVIGRNEEQLDHFVRCLEVQCFSGPNTR